MHKNLKTLHAAPALVAALLLAGCGGGGGSDSVAEPSGPVMVNAFAYVQPIVASGPSETAEPQAVDQLVLSTTDTQEPDPLL